MRREQPEYLAYLVRLWRLTDWDEREPAINQVKWRVSLENPHTREGWHFAGLEDLFEFLRVQTGYQSLNAGVIDEIVVVHDEQ